MKKTIMIMLVTMGCLHGGTVAVPPVVPVIPIVEDNKLYVGVAGGIRELREFEEALGMALIGYDITEYIGVEARYIGGNDYTNYGAFVKAQYDMEIFNPYVMGGYTHSEYKDSNFDYDGFAWVIGTDINTPIENLKVFTDLTYNLDHDDYGRSDHLFFVGLKLYL